MRVVNLRRNYETGGVMFEKGDRIAILENRNEILTQLKRKNPVFKLGKNDGLRIKEAGIILEPGDVIAVLNEKNKGRRFIREEDLEGEEVDLDYEEVGGIEGEDIDTLPDEEVYLEDEEDLDIYDDDSEDSILENRFRRSSLRKRF